MTASAAVARGDAAAELRDALVSRSLTCGVIGLGFVGSLIAEALHVAGFRVVGHDIAGEAVTRFGRPGASLDPAVLAESDVVVAAVRVSRATEPLDDVGALLDELPKRPRLLVVASTVPVGATRAFARRWASDEATFVVHAPERVQGGHDVRDLRSIPHLVGGLDAASLELGVRLLETYCDEVRPVSSLEVSELSKLLENAFRSVNIALIAEVTKIAHAAGVSAAEVAEAAATKPFGYHPFYPGPGVGGHCLVNDLDLLPSSALVDAARRLIDEMPAVTVDRLASLVPLHGARVLIVGTGYKPGSPEQTSSPARGIVRELRYRGATPWFVDSRNPTFAVDGAEVPAVRADALGAFDAAILVSGDDALGADELRLAAPIVLDANGTSSWAPRL